MALNLGNISGEGLHLNNPSTTSKKTVSTKKTNKKTIGGTLGYIGKEVAKGAGNFYESTGDFGGALLQGVGKLSSSLVNNKIGEFIFGKDAGNFENNPLYQIGTDMLQTDVVNDLLKPLDNVLDNKSYIKPGSVLGSIPQGIGYALSLGTNPIVAADKGVEKLIGKGVKGATMSGFGGGASESQKAGGTVEQNLGYGTLKGVIEGGSELMFGGLGKMAGKGALDDLIVDGITKNITNKVLKSAVGTALKGAGEGVEDLVSDILTPIAQKLTYEKGKSLKELYSDQNALEDFLVGMAVSMIMQTPSLITDIRKTDDTSVETEVNTDVETEQKNKLNLGSVQTVTDTKTDQQNLLTVQKFAEQVEAFDTEIEKLNAQLDVEPNVDKQQQIMTQINKLEIQKQARNEYIKSFKSVDPVINQQYVKSMVPHNIDVAKQHLQQIVQEQIDGGQLDAVAQIIPPTTEQQQIQTDIGSKFGIQIIFFEGNITPEEATIGNVVFVNSKPNAVEGTSTSQTIQWSLGHGLFHALKNNYPEVFNEYVEYVAEKITPVQAQDYIDTIRNESYKQKLTNDRMLLAEEIAADEFGNMFTDQKYWTELANDKPSLFNKLVNAINNILDKIGTVQFKTPLEKEQIDFIRNKFKNETAELLKSTNQTNEDVKYTYTAKERIDDSNLKILQIPKKGETLMLNQVIDHPELFAKVPKMANVKVARVDSNDNMNFSPLDNTINITNKINTNYKGQAKKIGVLLHEIQHAIQKVEKMPSGSNSLKETPGAIIQKIATKDTRSVKEIAKERYRNKPGEKQARQVTAEYLNAVGMKYTDRSKTVTYSDERFDDIVKQMSNGDESKGWLTKITPKQFIDLTAGYVTQMKLENETKPLDVNKLKGDKENIQLQINSKGKVVGHQGRHRMLGLNESGFTKDIPVVVYNVVDTVKSYSNQQILLDDVNNPFKKLKEKDITLKGQGQQFDYDKAEGTYDVHLTPVTSNIDKNQWTGKADLKYTDRDKTLSEQQKTYFKDSKIRDENGDMLEVYHGTEGNFNVFNIKKAGKTDEGWLGKGFYFTNDYDYASSYIYNRGDVKTVYLNIKNPYITDKHIERNDDFYKLIGVTNANEVTKKLKQLGYDGVWIKNKNSDNTPFYEIMAMYPNQIKNVNNLNPTESEDIRFSNRELQKAPTVTVSTGDGKSKFASNSLKKQQLFDPKFMLTEKQITNYAKTSNEQAVRTAVERLKTNGIHEVDNWFKKNNQTFDDTDIAEGFIIMNQYYQQGDPQSATMVAKRLRESLTKGGQRIQAASILQRMTPEGMVYYAQSELTEAWEKLNDIIDPKIHKWAQDNKDLFTLNKTEVDYINKRMTKYQTLDPDSREAKVILGEIKALIANRIPPEKGSSIKAWARISMLFNPKTMTRNVLGNIGVVPVNAVGDFIGSKLDKQLSKMTGVRTTGNMNLKQYGKGQIKGIGEAFDDYKRGIDTRSGDKFEIGQQGKNFKNTGIGKYLNKVDKMLTLGLDAGDRGFYEGAYLNSLYNQMKLNNVQNPTKEMIEIAREEALQRTWQDKNAFVEGVLSTRKLLNKVSLKGYGLGDMIIPFATTPANIAKAIYDYSPVAAISVAHDAKVFIDAKKTGHMNATIQKKFVNSFSKAMSGTLLYVIGYALANAGVISGSSDDDKDNASFMKTLGLNSYSIKIGGKTFTYDWAQPVSTPLAIMADIKKMQDEQKLGEGKGVDLGEVGNSILNALKLGGSTLYEQSFLQSVATLFGSDGPVEGLLQNASDLPSRFIPTFLKQINDLIDPYQRQQYEYNNLIQSSINKVAAKIPGLSQTLNKSKDVLGQDIKKYSGENDLFNVFFNPSTVYSNTANPVGIEIKNVYDVVGDNSAIPKVAPNYITYKGTKHTLTTEQKLEYQTITGTTVTDALKDLIDSDAYNNLTVQQKSDVISKTIEYATEQAKAKLIPDFERTSLTTTLDQYPNMDVGSYMMYKGVVSQIDGDKDVNGDTISGSKQGKQAWVIMNMNISTDLKNTMLDLITTSKTPSTVNELLKLDNESQYIDYFSLPATDFFIQKKISRNDYQNAIDFGMNKERFIDYTTTISEIKPDYNNKGETISGSKKQKILNYINSLPLNGYQRVLLLSMNGYSVKSYKTVMFNYINSLPISASRKQQIWQELGFE